ncbi:chymotrypsin inhibitor-like [Venturia canescens]|uniref:chymotrypsin inhibitor-like n=1 Tax=Venturia canescens TaxID=32260 RepID=UPI001C9CF8A0|nr:chymotrypsin inhibitor-like [Venturia canescens]
MVRTLVFYLVVAVAFLMFSGETNAQDESDYDFQQIERMCYGMDEVWNDCGTPCPRTCEQPEEIPCVKRCNPSCQCTRGLLRRRDGACVQASECF